MEWWCKHWHLSTLLGYVQPPTFLIFWQTCSPGFPNLSFLKHCLDDFLTMAPLPPSPSTWSFKFAITWASHWLWKMWKAHLLLSWVPLGCKQEYQRRSFWVTAESCWVDWLHWSQKARKLIFFHWWTHCDMLSVAVELFYLLHACDSSKIEGDDLLHQTKHRVSFWPLLVARWDDHDWTPVQTDACIRNLVFLDGAMAAMVLVTWMGPVLNSS